MVLQVTDKVKIQVGSKLITRDGKPIRIIATDAKLADNSNVVGLIGEQSGEAEEFIEWYQSDNVIDGYIQAYRQPSERDIKLPS